MQHTLNTNFIESKNIKCRVLKIGEGKPILFLHGWGCNAETMLSVANSLADKNACYLVDLPGFGQTPPPEKPWMVNDYALFVVELIDKLDIETCHIVAHSFGGRITIKLLSNPDFSKRFKRILITGGAGMKPKRKMSFYFRKYTAKFIKSPFLLLPPKGRDAGLSWLRKTSIWKKLGSSDFQQLDGVMRQVFINTVNEFLEVDLENIKHEVFLLWGEHDDATPLYQAERMKSLLKNATLVTIDNAGHYAFLDQPSKFNAIAKAYLQT